MKYLKQTSLLLFFILFIFNGYSQKTIIYKVTDISCYVTDRDGVKRDIGVDWILTDLNRKYDKWGSERYREWQLIDCFRYYITELDNEVKITITNSITDDPFKYVFKKSKSFLNTRHYVLSDQRSTHSQTLKITSYPSKNEFVNELEEIDMESGETRLLIFKGVEI